MSPFKPFSSKIVLKKDHSCFHLCLPDSFSCVPFSCSCVQPFLSEKPNSNSYDSRQFCKIHHMVCLKMCSSWIPPVIVTLAQWTLRLELSFFLSATGTQVFFPSTQVWPNIVCPKHVHLGLHNYLGLCSAGRRLPPLQNLMLLWRRRCIYFSFIVERPQNCLPEAFPCWPFSENHSVVIFPLSLKLWTGETRRGDKNHHLFFICCFSWENKILHSHPIKKESFLSCLFLWNWRWEMSWVTLKSYGLNRACGGQLVSAVQTHRLSLP